MDHSLDMKSNLVSNTAKGNVTSLLFELVRAKVTEHNISCTFKAIVDKRIKLGSRNMAAPCRTLLHCSTFCINNVAGFA